MTSRLNKLMAQMLLVTISYAVIANVSLHFGLPPSSASIVWPPAGLALAVVLYDQRLWIGVALGYILSRLPELIDPGTFSVDSSLLILCLSAGASAQAFLSSRLIRLFISIPNSLDTPKDVSLFILLGGPIGCTISATIGAFSLFNFGIITSDSFWNVWLTWWGGDTIGSIIFAPVLTLMFLPSSKVQQSRKNQVGTILLTLFFISIAFLVNTRDSRTNSSQVLFEQQSDEIFEILKQNLNQEIQGAEALLDIYRVKGILTENEFDSIASGLLERRRAILALQWSPHITHNQREAFESQPTQKTGKGITITELENGRFIPAKDRNNYLPVRYRMGVDNQPQIIGYDYYSSDKLKRGVEYAIKYKKPSLVSDIKLIQDEKKINGFFYILPAFLNEPDYLDGILVGVLRLSNLIESSIDYYMDLGYKLCLDEKMQDGRYKTIYGANCSFHKSTVQELELHNKSWQIKVGIDEQSFFAIHHQSDMTLLVASFILVGGIGGIILIITGQASVVQNLVARKTEEIRLENNKLESITNMIYILIAYIDKNGVYQFVNKNYADFIGYEVNNIEGHSIDEILTKNNPLGIQEKINQALNGEIVSFIRDFNDSQGNKCYFQITYYPDIDNTKTIQGFYCSAIDVTDIQNASIEMEKAKDLAEQTSNSKSTFLANVSHEIRTPLNGIIGAIDLLKESDLNDGQSELLVILENSSTFLLNLVNDLLDLAKLEANKMEIENVEFNLARLCEDIIETYKGKANNKGIDLLLETDSNSDHIFVADVVKIRQIVQNLTDNAIKFTSEGEVKLSCYKDGHNFIINVKDTGIGISEEQQAHVFDKFVQADERITRKFGGTGLGLNLCKEYADLLGWQIQLKSELTKGTEFQLLLTLTESDNADSTNEAQKKISEFTQLEGRILLAEDNPTNRTIAVKMLDKIGVQVDTANNGAEAIEQFKKNKYDIILMDCQMPVVDGITATRDIRASEAVSDKPRTPIIAFTANVSELDIENTKAAGMDDFVSKPVKFDSLYHCLERWML